MESKGLFENKFPNSEDVLKVFCPYRICPLGAHVDHQLGKILGFSIDHGVEMEFIKTEDGEISVQSENFVGETKFNVNDNLRIENHWGDYLIGAVCSLKRSFDITFGIKGIIRGSLPIGGLSSSAAVIITYILAICKANSIELEKSEIIHYALWVENDFIGIKVGKLDQSCEVLSKKDNLLYLDTKTDEYRLIPKNPNMKPFKIAIIFSGIERALANSNYNVRVDECKATAYALKAYSYMDYKELKDTYLRDVPEEIFETYKDKLPRNFYKRATHFYTEKKRVKAGIEAWKSGDLEAFGNLVFESGRSSINNYETGSKELITLHNIMENTDGIYGGRFSGAGFKGCCMAIIDPEKQDEIKENITKKYLDTFPELSEKFSIHICDLSNGCEC